MLKPTIFYNFRFEHAGEYFASFLIETHGGKAGKAKMPRTFPFQAKTHGAVQHLVWKKSRQNKNALGFRISSKNAWTDLHFGKFFNKTRGPNAIQAKTHGASEKKYWAPRVTLNFQKILTSKTCLTGVLKPIVFYNFWFEHVGEYFASFFIETHTGKVNKAKTPEALRFQAKTREGF